MIYNGHYLVTRRGERFNFNCSDWTKLSYLTHIYDEIYDQMVEAGVAVRTNLPIYCDKEGNVVIEDSGKKYGFLCTICLD